jgi:Na+/H+ antiporter NhaD/arsenite permease-like protein
MNIDQILTLLVLAAVVAALIWDKVRPDVVALTGAAILLMTGVVRPVEVQGAFASPAIIAIARSSSGSRCAGAPGRPGSGF